MVLVELKSLSGASKAENLFVTTNKIEISLQLLVELKSLDGANKAIQSFVVVSKIEISWWC